MDNRNGGYGPLLLLLSQFLSSNRQNPLLQAPEAGEASQMLTGGVPQMQASEAAVPAGQDSGGSRYFAEDETESTWRRQERVELLAEFCREGYAMARRHGHFLVGSGRQGTFLAVPGRFLLEEQPAGGVTGFTLWQPLAGGEELYDTLENLSEDLAREVFGYWIARLDPDTLKLTEVCHLPAHGSQHR